MPVKNRAYKVVSADRVFALVAKRVEAMGGELIAVRKSFFNGDDAFVVLWQKGRTEYVTHSGNLWSNAGKLEATFYLGHYCSADTAEAAHATALNEFAKRR